LHGRCGPCACGVVAQGGEEVIPRRTGDCLMDTPPRSETPPSTAVLDVPAPNPLLAAETMELFHNFVWPGLKQFADSEFINLSLFEDAADALPATDREAWLDLVRRLDSASTEALGRGRLDRNPFVSLPRLFWDILRAIF